MITAFWNVTPYNLEDRYRRLMGNILSPSSGQSSTVKTEAAHSSETKLAEEKRYLVGLLVNTVWIRTVALSSTIAN
jgi:hypothetical protein